MDAPVLPGYALEAPAGPGPGTGRSLLDGSRVTVERLTGDERLTHRAVDLEQVLRRADGRHLARIRAVVVGVGEVHLVRDHVDGPDLDQLRREVGGRLDVDLAVHLVRGVLDALADLHAVGLTHGALDAAAVRIDASVPLRPSVRLTGWGTAALRGGAGTCADDLRAAGRLLLGLVSAGPEEGSGPDLDRRLAPALAALLPADPLADPDLAAARDALAAGGSPSRPSARGVPSARPGAAPLPPAPPPRREPSRARSRPAAPLRAAAAAALLLAVAAAVVLGRTVDDGDARVPVQPATSAPYDFPPLARADGLVVLRSWSLEQGGAVLRGTTVVRNDGDAPRSAGVDEVVPKSVADDVDDLTFSPRPDVVVRRDPVVRFELLGLAPGATTSWQFTVALPSPVRADALSSFAADAERARLEHERDPGATSSPGPGGELTPPLD